MPAALGERQRPQISAVEPEQIEGHIGWCPRIAEKVIELRSQPTACTNCGPSGSCGVTSSWATNPIIADLAGPELIERLPHGGV
jgi:hypothetical protein